MANAVAKKEAASKEVAVYDASVFEQFANAGMEDVRSDDMSVPFLRILAQLSPQVNKRDGAYVNGAEAGMIYNTVANEVYSGEDGVTVIPCYYSRRYVEWKPREKGGGYVGSYSADDPVVSKTVRDDKGNDILPNGNLLTNTAQFFVIMMHETLGPQRCLITMSSTQLKKARKWLTQMQSLQAKGKNGMFTLPMMSHKYRLRTVEERNDKGSWFGWDITREGPLDMAEEADLFEMALSFAKSVKAGEVKVKEEMGDENFGKSSPRSQDDDNVPF